MKCQKSDESKWFINTNSTTGCSLTPPFLWGEIKHFSFDYSCRHDSLNACVTGGINCISDEIETFAVFCHCCQTIKMDLEGFPSIMMALFSGDSLEFNNFTTFYGLHQSRICFSCQNNDFFAIFSSILIVFTSENQRPQTFCSFAKKCKLSKTAVIEVFQDRIFRVFSQKYRLPEGETMKIYF